MNPSFLLLRSSLWGGQEGLNKKWICLRIPTHLICVVVFFIYASAGAIGSIETVLRSRRPFLNVTIPSTKA